MLKTFFDAITDKGGREWLFEKPFNWTKFWCRLSGHSAGPIFYNPGGLEPDWTCKNCGDQTQ